jgi:hypothetical protein
MRRLLLDPVQYSLQLWQLPQVGEIDDDARRFVNPGGALYINIVEQPARLSLDARSMIREWMPSDWLGFVMLATLAIVSAFSAYAEYIRSGDIGWLLGGSIILASWPYAYFVIIPVNNLYGIRNVPASMVRTLMRDWGLLEWGQTGIGLAAACVFGWTFVTPP